MGCSYKDQGYRKGGGESSERAMGGGVAVG